MYAGVGKKYVLYSSTNGATGLSTQEIEALEKITGVKLPIYSS